MEEDNSWVFDSLVCFLNGPVWNAPLQTFIEEKSLIFEPSVEEHEDYKNIFDEFKNLVDFMLGNFMEDIGITPVQFEDACKEGKKYQVAFDHNLFEQIWAANDYEMFKKMMIQRNVELQLQALELIERKYGITPQSFIPKNKRDNVREIPVTIEKPSELESNVMEEVYKTFPHEEEPSTSLEVKNILEEKESLEKKLQETKDKIVDQIESTEHLGDKMTDQVNKLPSEEKSTIHEPRYSEPSEKVTPQVDNLDLKKRQEYLRAQRDKLVALKKEARSKQLDVENNSNDKSRVRPKSAKAAKAVLTGEKPNMEPQQLLIRKTLAERLRSEVVSKKVK